MRELEQENRRVEKEKQEMTEKYLREMRDRRKLLNTVQVRFTLDLATHRKSANIPSMEAFNARLFRICVAISECSVGSDRQGEKAGL